MDAFREKGLFLLEAFFFSFFFSFLFFISFLMHGRLHSVLIFTTLKV